MERGRYKKYLFDSNVARPATTKWRDKNKLTIGLFSLTANQEATDRSPGDSEEFINTVQDPRLFPNLNYSDKDNFNMDYSITDNYENQNEPDGNKVKYF